MVRGKKLVIGVGGNIGSGKTTVAKIFRSMGAQYISADRIGWEVLQDIKPDLRRHFGNGVFIGGRVDREKLRNVVFSNPGNLRVLNQLSHPRLLKRIYKRLTNIRSGMVVIDAALLFFWSDLLKKIDYPILVKSRFKLKRMRALKKGIPPEVFEQIIRFQQSESQIAKKAKFVITNNGTLWQLKKQCQKIFKELKDDC